MLMLTSVFRLSTDCLIVQQSSFISACFCLSLFFMSTCVFAEPRAQNGDGRQSHFTHVLAYNRVCVGTC